MSEQPLTPAGPDPIESAEPKDLRIEILRLRDLNLGLQSHAEVLVDRVAELEAQNMEINEALSEVSQNAQRTIDELNEANQALHVELGRSPIIRVARTVARRLKLR